MWLTGRLHREGEIVDCINVPDNKIVSFIAGAIVMLILVIGGWIAVNLGDS